MQMTLQYIHGFIVIRVFMQQDDVTLDSLGCAVLAKTADPPPDLLKIA